MPTIITLTTDFGLDDPYVGEMKGAILCINPAACIVDISHSIAPHDVRQGAFFLESACDCFPAGTTHVAVVDPGVGGDRRGILVKGPSYTFVAPDNGLLSYVAGGAKAGRGADDTLVEGVLPDGYEALELTEPRFWRSTVSPTFHGRDIFGPVAAHVSLGADWHGFGRRLNSIKYLTEPRPGKNAAGEVEGRIVHVDHFGNAITNLRQADLPGTAACVIVAGRRIQGLSRTYEDGKGLIALLGSSGRLEISVRNGSAAVLLGLRRGDIVRVSAGS